MQHRQIAVGGVAPEELVAASPRQSYGEPGSANGLRNVVGVEPVEGRLVQAVQSPSKFSTKRGSVSTTSWCWVPMAAAICLAMGPSFSSSSSKASVKVWMGALGRALGQVGDD